MTTVGKILVLVNLVLSLMFMMFAVAVYATRQDLRAQLNKANTQITSAKSEAANAQAEKAKVQQNLEQKTVDMEKQGRDLKAELDKAKADREEAYNDFTKAKDEANRAVTQMKIATDEQVKRKAEVDQLITIRNDLLKKNDELVQQKGGLLDQVSELTNNRDSLKSRNVTLNDRITKLEAYLVKREGSAPDDAKVDLVIVGGPSAAPEVEGIVTKVDHQSNLVQISLGEDDGIRKGQELEVWRTKPEPKYVGKVRIFTTQNTTATAKPVPGKLSGKILQDDRVGPQIMVNK